MKVVQAQNPVRKSATVIDLQVLFEELQGEGFLPFSASLNDTEPHGRDLYARAVAGEFGEIG